MSQRLKQILYNMPVKQRWLIGIMCAVVYCWVYYSFFVSPTGYRWRAIYGDPDYPKGYEIHGIDISHHQGTIDWNRLRNALIEQTPIRFVIIKGTEGDSYLDSKFRENFFYAREKGFIRGVYHFWSNNSSPRRQAYFFLAMVKLVPGDLPPVLDVESKPRNISTEAFQQNVLTWLHIVEDKYQVKPILYTGYRFKQQYLSDSRFDSYPFWIAHYYVSKMEYGGEWKFWQHTDVGRLPGINNFVDLNIYNGSFYDLQKLTIPVRKVVVIRDNTNLHEQVSDTVVTPNP